MDTGPDATGPSAVEPAEGTGTGSAEVVPAPRYDEYPQGILVGMVDDLPSAHAAVAAISGYASGSAYVIASEEILRQDAARRAEQGVLTKAYLAFASALSDQDRLQGVFVDQARLGRHMVAAMLGDDAEADATWTTLKAHGAHDGTYFGRFTVREMV